jgi:hypothetical protein
MLTHSANSFTWCEHLPCWRADFEKKVNYSMWYCIQQWLSVESVETIIHEHLWFKKVCAQGIPKMVTLDQKTHCVVVSAEHNWLEWEGNTFLETWQGCTTSLQSQSSHSAVTRDLQHQKYSRHRCQLARSWQVCFGTQKKSFMLIFFYMV